MDARPLRELLADLAGDAEARHAYGADPAGYLAAHGHPDLPEPLVAEAVVSYADTAPVEVAEALAPYVTAHGPVPVAEPVPDWFELLTSSEVGENPVDEHLDTPAPAADWSDLDFGAGADAAPVEEPEAPLVSATDTDLVEEAPEPEPEWVSDAPFAPEPPIEGLAPEDDEPLD